MIRINKLLSIRFTFPREAFYSIFINRKTGFTSILGKRRKLDIVKLIDIQSKTFEKIIRKNKC
jgi:hypothetical protein